MPHVNPEGLHVLGSRRLLRLATITAVTVTAGLALGACGAGDPAARGADPDGGVPSASTVAWAGSLCSAMDPLFATLDGRPAVLDPDPVAARAAALDLLPRLDAALRVTTARLAALGPAPVENGEQVLDEVDQELADLRRGIDDVAPRLRSAGSLQLGRVMDRVRAVLSFGPAQLDPALRGAPGLREAVQRAPACTRF